MVHSISRTRGPALQGQGDRCDTVSSRAANSSSRVSMRRKSLSRPNIRSTRSHGPLARAPKGQSWLRAPVVGCDRLRETGGDEGAGSPLAIDCPGSPTPEAPPDPTGAKASTSASRVSKRSATPQRRLNLRRADNPPLRVRYAEREHSNDTFMPIAPLTAISFFYRALDSLTSQSRPFAAPFSARSVRRET